MKPIILPLFFLFLSAQCTVAQDYMDYMEQGKYYFNKKNFLTAFEKFDLALEIANSETGKKDAQNWKNSSLKNLKDYMEKMEQLLEKNEIELNYSRGMINAIYFYDNKITLAIKEDKFGYLNKNGKVTIPFKYDHAAGFELKTGFAKVTRDGKNYLIDTTGKEYSLATNISSINGTTEAIDLREQNLNEIPENVFNYKAIKILLLSNNKIKDLPEAITRLKELTYLDVSNNVIPNLPGNIADLANLRQLQLQNNLISKLPDGIVFLTKLTKIDLSNNKLFSLPENMGSLYQLKELNLDGNKLTTLPEDIGQLRSLKILSIQNNSIKHVPAGIANLSQLKSLYLNQNNITDLPADIGRLIYLEHLYLARNQLGYLPIEIKQLANLKSIDLQSNPIPQQKKPLIEGWLPNCIVLF